MVAGVPAEDNPYVFNGDFVDRGSFSVEVVLTLLAFKCAAPESMIMIRGNHESQVRARGPGFGVLGFKGLGFQGFGLGLAVLGFGVLGFWVRGWAPPSTPIPACRGHGFKGFEFLLCGIEIKSASLYLAVAKLWVVSDWNASG